MEKLEVDWERVEREWNEGLPPPTPDDVSRALDGTPLDSGAAIIRHMAKLEAQGLGDSGTMFRDLLVVLERDGEDAMMAEMHRIYGPQCVNQPELDASAPELPEAVTRAQLHPQASA